VDDRRTTAAANEARNDSPFELERPATEAHQLLGVR